MHIAIATTNIMSWDAAVTEHQGHLTLFPCRDIKDWQGDHEDYHWSKGGHEVCNDTQSVL